MATKVERSQYYGTNVQEFLNMPWENIDHMNKRELRDFAQRASTAANKRVKNMYNALGEYSPGVQKFLDAGGGKVNLKMSVNQLRKSVANLQSFLAPPDTEHSTTTLTAYREYLEFYSEKFSEIKFQSGDEVVRYKDLSTEARRNMWHFVDSAISQNETKVGTSGEMGSNEFIPLMIEKWVSLNQPHFEKGQDIATVGVTREELGQLEQIAIAEHSRNIRNAQNA